MVLSNRFAVKSFDPYYVQLKYIRQSGAAEMLRRKLFEKIKFPIEKNYKLIF